MEEIKDSPLKNQADGQLIHNLIFEHFAFLFY